VTPVVQGLGYIEDMIFNYIRVSTITQNSERQLIDVACDRQYADTCSGKDKERPQLQAMLLNLRDGDQINVHELSRLARNTKDLLSIVEEILYKKSSIHFHKENLRFTPNIEADPFQKLMLTMLGAISTFERDLMLERQREGIAIAKAKGKYKGKQCRFSADEIADIKEKFSASKNKAALAKELGISRPYLYRLVA
jgi:DNA invertase Pin-like site-specific DNA recombinase